MNFKVPTTEIIFLTRQQQSEFVDETTYLSIIEGRQFASIERMKNVISGHMKLELYSDINLSVNQLRKVGNGAFGSIYHPDDFHRKYFEFTLIKYIGLLQSFYKSDKSKSTHDVLVSEWCEKENINWIK